MRQDSIDQIYKENDLLKKELQSMQVLLNENAELRSELVRVQKMSYDDRVREIGEENERLRKRNGKLLVENTDLQDEVRRLKREQPLIVQTQQ
jgi:hypothetical protein